MLKAFTDSNNPASFGYRARQRRMELLTEKFPDFENMEIIDLGGDTRYWKAQSVRPRKVTIVALAEWALRDPEPWMEGMIADACDADAFSGTYDLVFSNSVIEHVGGSRYRRGFADTVAKLSTRHWIQTPYRYFPLEPHFKFPGFQFLPLRARVAVATRWPGSMAASRPDLDPVEYVVDHELISRTELQALFPESEIVIERIGGLPKSLIAVRA